MDKFFLGWLCVLFLNFWLFSLIFASYHLLQVTRGMVTVIMTTVSTTIVVFYVWFSINEFKDIVERLSRYL